MYGAVLMPHQPNLKDDNLKLLAQWVRPAHLTI